MFALKKTGLMAALVVVGCGDGTDRLAEARFAGIHGSCSEPDDWSGSCFVTGSASLGFEAGYQGIEAADYTLLFDGLQKSYQSSRARLWYAFQPAQDTPESKPLAVFFNGGPGASTSSLLFALNTGAITFDPAFAGSGIVANPNAWTEFANLLYIDARNAGFSYGLMENPDDARARHAQLASHNHNSFLDGADFVRVILRFLARHPALQDNPVMLVGESYGGLRATVILHLLLHFEEYGGGARSFEDRALAEEIAGHFYSIYPDIEEGQEIPRARIAAQFSRQVLIQPLLSGLEEGAVKGHMWEQPGSVMHQIAALHGLTFVPCSAQGGACHPVKNGLDFVYDIAQRDIYHWAEPRDWTVDLGETVSLELVEMNNLREATGVEVAAIDWLHADSRRNAYRIGDPDQLQSQIGVVIGEGDLPEHLGKLPEWDGYHIFFNDYVWQAFRGEDLIELDVWHGSPRYAPMFLENVLWVDTFLTNAAYDLKVFSMAQPPVLASHTDYLHNLTHDPGGWLELEYTEAYERGCPRNIRFPFYDAGHTVAASQPALLRHDVLDWLNDGLQCE